MKLLDALRAWLADPAQAELRRSLLLWLREGFLQTRLLDDPQRLARCIKVPQVSTPQALLYQRLTTLP